MRKDRNYIQKSLTKTWTNIYREITAVANDESADCVVQVTERIGSWNLEDNVYQQANNYSPIPTVASVNRSNQNFGKLPIQIDELQCL
ncbi:hypothetical protein OnM2_074034 [Erysiphe neolycopersici]|uniref:Uncharacterized protein n=1 Tax=Erysiphe neolycopersici TaxID=212602 RepID=A0A420HIT0_9PEZI|nr:hypothetical protein OnM2_074034 [Erysiphe neolycopersici]